MHHSIQRASELAIHLVSLVARIGCDGRYLAAHCVGVSQYCCECEEMKSRRTMLSSSCCSAYLVLASFLTSVFPVFMVSASLLTLRTYVSHFVSLIEHVTMINLARSELL